MTTTTYPEFVLTTLDELAAGEWAFAKFQGIDQAYSLVMVTDKPCPREGQESRRLLVLHEGSAGFYCSTQFQRQAAQISGDIRIPCPLGEQAPETGHSYQPGLLYFALSEQGLYLVAQLNVRFGAVSVMMNGTGAMDEIPDRADLWRAERVEYRAPGDNAWHELAKIDTKQE